MPRSQEPERSSLAWTVFVASLMLASALAPGLAAPGLEVQAPPAPEARRVAPPADLTLPTLTAWAAGLLPPLEGPRAVLATWPAMLPPTLSPTRGLPHPLLLDPAEVGGALGMPGSVLRGALDVDALWVVDGDLTLEHAAVRFGPDGGLFVRGALTAHDTVFLGENPSGSFARPQIDAALALARALKAGEDGTGPLEAMRGRAGDSYVYSTGAADVRGATFAGAGLVLLRGPEPAVVRDSQFLGGTYGLLAQRSDLHVAGSTFAGLQVGLGVFGRPADGADAVVYDDYPVVENNTFEMDIAGLVVYDGAGRFHHNLARGNQLGAACLSPGYFVGEDQHRALLSDNNFYTNLGDGISGIRGASIPNPFDPTGEPIPLAVNSECDYDRNYLGPAGDKRDSVFLSADDTNTDVQDEAIANSAPALPMPMTEITDTVTWDTAHELNGPVVVNAPGKLTVKADVRSNASKVITYTYFDWYCSCYLEVTYTLSLNPFLGAKLKGNIVLDSGAHTRFNEETYTSTAVFFRNDADALRNGARLGEPSFGGPYGGEGLRMYRCNCTTNGATIDAAQGIVAQSGLLTDDAQWTPSITDTTFHSSTAIYSLANVKPKVDASDIYAYNGLGQDTLSSFVTTNNDFHTVGTGYIGLIGTSLSSSGDTFEGGSSGVLGAIDVTTLTNDLLGNQGIAAANLIGSYTQSLTNITLNHVGVYMAVTNGAVSNSNFVDNEVAAIAEALDLTGNGIAVGSVACTNCYAPPDETWAPKDVTWSAALAPNAVQQPSWNSKQKVALDGQTVDLGGALEDGPAVARSGGTLRVQDASLSLNQRFPLMVKGGGMTGNNPTGKLVLDNASLSWAYGEDDWYDFDVGGYWPAIVANSTDSRVTMSTFSGFEGAPLQASHNGFGTFECVDWEHPYFPLVQFVPGPGASQLTMRRVRVTTSVGLEIGNPYSVVPPLAGTRDGDVLVEDSGLRGASPGSYHGPFLTRYWYSDQHDGAGDVVVKHTNLLGPRYTPGIIDAGYAPNLTALDARENYWGDALGPDREGSYAGNYGYDPYAGTYVTMLTSGFATQPYAPQPCMAWEVVSSPALDEAPVAFRDWSFDPSGLDATRTWTWGDGTSTTTDALALEHQFPTWGTYTVNLTLASDSGGSDTMSRSVRVLTRPLPSFTTTPAAALETDTLRFTSTSYDPDGTVTAWAWDFGDGATATTANPSHRYAEGGTKTITLTVTDNDGLQKTLVTTLDVAHAPPVAGFTFSRTQLAVQFDDTSSHPNPADAPPSGWSYAWDLGDGTLSTERDPAHTYEVQDVYTVTLSVIDNDGQTATLTKAVDLRNKPPVPDFNVAPFAPVAGEYGGPATFHDESTDEDGTVVGWLWDFGDGATSTAQDPQHFYAEGGDYLVTLTATDDQGASNTTSRIVHACETGAYVEPNPHVELCVQLTAQGIVAFGQAVAAALPGQVEQAAADAQAAAQEAVDGVVAQVPPPPEAPGAPPVPSPPPLPPL